MKTPELPPAAYIRVDIFPAKITSPAIDGGVLNNVRVVVSDAHVHVLRLTSIGDVELAFSAELFSVEKAPTIGKRGVRVITVEDDQLEIIENGTCGCGMKRLRSAKLYPVNPPLAAF